MECCGSQERRLCQMILLHSDVKKQIKNPPPLLRTRCSSMRPDGFTLALLATRPEAGHTARQRDEGLSVAGASSVSHGRF